MKTVKRIIVVLLLFLTIKVFAQNCSKSFFDCGNGKCIANFFVCDDDNDCGNFLDEMNCTSSISKPKTNCPDDTFACNDFLDNCIPQRWVCDGANECANGADEANCTKNNSHCGSGDFQCGNFDCIPLLWKCDGLIDCSDGSDEKDCDQFAKDPFCDKKHGKFQCNNGKCIEFRLVCDGRKDCSSGEDEASHCHEEKCKTSECSHSCLIDFETKEPKCYCPPGYTLINEKTCVDFDECRENKISNVCSQKCSNLDGNYKCYCNDGYQLVGNSSCIAKGSSPLLFVSTGIDIHGIDVRSDILFPVVQNDKSDMIVVVDINVKTQKLYYSIYADNSHSSIYETIIPPGPTLLIRPERKLIFNDAFSQIEGISVDWLADHVYLTEYNNKKIIVCNIDSMICATLKKDLDSPRGILVIPDKGKLFWTQWGNDSGIFEAWMDGSDSAKLFSDVDWPNDLAYDEAANRLYWCEGRLGKIEYYDFDTEIRHEVYQDRNRQPFSLFVFEDSLYWTDWQFRQLIKCDKINCHHLEHMLQPSLKRGRGIYGIGLYHSVLQKSTISTPNPCSNHECSHLCLIKTPDSYICFCPDNSYLSSDNKTCVTKSDKDFVLISTGLQLFKFYPDSSNKVLQQVPLPTMFFIQELAFNPVRNEIYIFDEFKDRIVMVKSKKRNYDVIVDYDLNAVYSLTYDVNTDNIFWVDMNKGTLEAASVQKSYRAIVNSKLRLPISMGICAQNKLIYVGLKQPAQIVALTMDGKFVKSIIKAKLGLPMALVIHMNELIWADPIIQKIDFMNLKPKIATTPIRDKLAEKHVGTVHSMAVANSNLFWTNTDSPALYWISLVSKNQTIGQKRIPEHQFDNDVLRVVSGQKQSAIYNYCIKNNPCGHICLIGKYGPTCRCALGYSSTDNGINCFKNTSPIESNRTIFHLLTLEKVLDFIHSNQKDQINDTWEPINTDNSTTTIAPAPTTLVQNQSSTNWFFENETLIEEASFDSETITTSGLSAIRLISSIVLSVTFVVLIFLLTVIFAKIRIGPFPTVRSFLFSIRERMTDSQPNDDAVQFFSNPNYDSDFMSKRNRSSPHPTAEVLIH